MILWLFLGCGSDTVEPQRSPILGDNNTRLIHVPAGSYLIGKVGEGIPIDEGPPFRFRTEGFYLQEKEVSNQQYAVFLTKKGFSLEEAARYVGLRGSSTHPANIAYTGKRFRASFGYEHYPVTAVSFAGAELYCNYWGMRLPTEFEWEIAAKGGTEHSYPWGEERNNEYANIAKKWQVSLQMPIQESASYSPNAYGLYDMIGNAAELTSSTYSAYPSSEQLMVLEDDNRRVLRGGDWSSSWEDARVTARESIHRDARGFYKGAVGFRCAKDTP